MEKQEQNSICREIGARTGGDIYIGVVGPVRSGKSTFIKRFMEQLVLPAMSGSAAARERARDELPQSAAGRTIMTTEPKFIPETAVPLQLEGGGACRVRLIDCVGYMVEGAMGHEEDAKPRMVKSPWFDHEVPFDLAAETGTRKVICEHSTIGIVVTTDGSVTEIPREDYLEAEERVIRELQELGKPFVVLLNSAQPQGSRAQSMAADIERRYDVRCLPVNCLELGEQEITELLQGLLYEFPLRELDLFLPAWVEALPPDHPIKTGVYQAVRREAADLAHVRQLRDCLSALQGEGDISAASIRSLNLGIGIAEADLDLPRSLFYDTLSRQSGLSVTDDGDLMQLLTSLAAIRKEYDRLAPAMQAALDTGYGIVMPSVEELNLEDPEIVRQGGRYSVRMKASAPSVHMIRADIATTVSPIVGNEKQSEDMVNYLLQEFEGDTGKLWQSNIFGRSFHEIVGDDLQAKLRRMPLDSQKKLREALERIINDGSGGLICIIL